MRTIRHTKLGELQWEDEGWWQGEARVTGGELPFAVRGDKRGPDEPLATALAATIASWPDIVKKTKAFLTKHGGRAAGDFAVLAIVFLSTPTHFAIDLETEEDDADEPAIWKLEFENGEPKQLTRDE
jgi:hypothetical protein